ncbi:AraC family transcriptional regulator [Pleomorphomonas diazotrophica]|uniref:AraC family transcriptional regulator n=1 Tax=Pleomorphomonas diazotrophica TaxID=1166257 RepID=A0A1I4U6U1_9HYPH|nr:AraC family transcriptional regulator [Pleomorphomonas diazotrophica]PKR91191.1 AraC family transcriptional regulator [Pleomorphomonas diazotrophica]SFM84605.1 transcriptional regulator, AraC family [Pleomorphomonas diazotrophica]
MGVLEKAVWYLELNIGRPFTLAELADLCGASPWHLTRLFQTNVGLAPMSYLRARRLTIAAEALAKGDQDILPIALDAGYGSHEAFTRAFAGCFGMLPSAVRLARTTCNLPLMEPWTMNKDMIIDIAAPEFRERGAFRVMGLSTRCTFETNSVIPKLWGEFDQHCNEIPSPVAGVYYGVCCDMEADGHFRYVAGQATTATHVPDGLDTVDIPASRYAVFKHVGHISDFNKTVYTIWNKALPDAGLTPAKAPDFELYDERYDPKTSSGTVEIWIPLA